MDEGDTGTVEAFGGECFAKGIDEIEVVVESSDIELAVGGESAGEGAIGQSDDHGEAGLDREIFEVGLGERMALGGEGLRHVVHAGVEFIDGAEFGPLWGFRADAVGIAGVWLEVFENDFVTEFLGGRFDDGAKLAGGSVGDDGFAGVAGFPKEEGFSGSEEANGGPDGEGNALGFFGDGGEFFL